MSKMSTFQIGIKGVIVRDDRILMLHMSDKDLWEIPGGRIDEGEDDYEETLLRELYEELPDIRDVIVGDILHAHQTDFLVAPDCHLMLLFVRVTASLPQQPSISHEHTEVRWIGAHELAHLPMNPTHRRALRHVFKTMAIQKLQEQTC